MIGVERALTVIALLFSGVEFPIHPLDLTVVGTWTFEVNGQSTDFTYCFNAFQNSGTSSDEDAILGDPFLRNVYAS